MRDVAFSIVRDICAYTYLAHKYTANKCIEYFYLSARTCVLVLVYAYVIGLLT